MSILDENEGWFDAENLPPTLLAIIEEVGRMYAPFMLGNAAAVDAGEREVDCLIDGGKVRWRQASFKYQHKCVGWLRDHYVSLPKADRATVDGVMAGTGCEEMFTGLGGAGKL